MPLQMQCCHGTIILISNHPTHAYLPNKKNVVSSRLVSSRLASSGLVPLLPVCHLFSLPAWRSVLCGGLSSIFVVVFVCILPILFVVASLSPFTCVRPSRSLTLSPPPPSPPSAASSPCIPCPLMCWLDRSSNLCFCSTLSHPILFSLCLLPSPIQPLS